MRAVFLRTHPFERRFKLAPHTQRHMVHKNHVRFEVLDGLLHHCGPQSLRARTGDPQLRGLKSPIRRLRERRQFHEVHAIWQVKDEPCRRPDQHQPAGIGLEFYDLRKDVCVSPHVPQANRVVGGGQDPRVRVRRPLEGGQRWRDRRNIRRYRRMGQAGAESESIRPGLHGSWRAAFVCAQIPGESNSTAF